jgi:hypothetical protein
MKKERLVLIRNRVKCLECGEILESKSIHDYQECSCPNHCFTDGGSYYQRCGAMRLSKIAILNEDDSERKFRSEIDWRKEGRLS